MFCSRCFLPIFSLLAICWLNGCGGGPARIEPPAIDANDAAEKAMEIYDVDGDGFIAGEELSQASGLNAAIKNLDTDEDGKVSEAEIVARIHVWQGTRIGLTFGPCTVYMDNRPLEGATVTYTPERFLGPAIQASVGVTNFAGEANPRIPKDKRPSPDSPPGVQIGLYKVHISKVVNSKETVPSKYNVETVLGQEISPDDWALLNSRIRFDMTSQ